MALVDPSCFEGLSTQEQLQQIFEALADISTNTEGGSSGASITTGAVLDYVGVSAPTGYVLASGKTIGSAASGGTERANADTEALFTLLWNSMADAEAPVSGGRGGSAAADFSANKTIAVPDLRGRVVAGRDDMGGVAANRMTVEVNGAVQGDSGGEESHILTIDEMPSHTHGYEQFPIGSGTEAYGAGSDSSGSGLTEPVGGDQAHNNVQPTMVMFKIIKL